jgi:hypothetical protein
MVRNELQTSATGNSMSVPAASKRVAVAKIPKFTGHPYLFVEPADPSEESN